MAWFVGLGGEDAEEEGVVARFISRSRASNRSGSFSLVTPARILGSSAAAAAAPPATPIAPAARTFTAFGMSGSRGRSTYQAATNSSTRSRTWCEASSPSRRFCNRSRS